MERGRAMKLPGISGLGFQLRLTMARFGWINCAACGLLLLAVIAWSWGIAYLQAQTTAPQRSLQQAQQALKESERNEIVTTLSLPEQGLRAYYDVLGDRRYVEQQIKTLFAVAGKTGLSLNQAEYKSAYDKNSRTHTYQVTLPIKGSYESIRKFCEQTLLAIPFASLDELNFKRDAINNATLEAKLRFTFYLAGDARDPANKNNGDDAASSGPASSSGLPAASAGSQSGAGLIGNSQ
jgi:hypothetical protein